ncbi:MAG: adenosylmethionine--8-amino-7-oxononanoate transaminase [Acidobacteria bacterium]|nr:MAG: adenosylmethionine--8-amino-7-oxononanoate transaminase [Acidobacteriota bacterium]
MEEWLSQEPLIIERGEGNWLIDTEGRRYLDGVSSLWCNVHGHCNPRLDRALSEQAGRIAHSTMLGMSNPPAIELAEKLCGIAPAGLSRVFYAENGASAVEIALKMAYQYWQHSGEVRRTKFVGLDLAYHGDTLGAVSVGGIETFHAAFEPLLFEALHSPTPFPYRSPSGDCAPENCRDYCLSKMDALLAENAGGVAAVIVEPLVQGAAGIIVHPSGFLAGVRELCDRHEVLLICDEVATGFGRTGAMFACEHEDVSPDLMVVGKGLTGGYLPLSAAVATEEIFSAFLGRYDEFKTFFHGHTYTGNPLACAVGLENLKIFDDEQTLESLMGKIERLELRLEKFRGAANVGDVRSKGLMAGIELVADPLTGEMFPPGERVGGRVCEAAREFGVAIRPLGDVVVLMPPLSITLEEIDLLCDAVEQASVRVLQ